MVPLPRFELESVDFETETTKGRLTDDLLRPDASLALHAKSGKRASLSGHIIQAAASDI